jgi:TP901 family phage tail tape measure protein
MARTRIIAGKAVIVIEAFDQVSKNLGKIRSNLHQFANTVGNLGETAFRAGFFGSIASGALVTGFVKFDDAMRILRVNLDLFGKSAKQVDSVMKPLEERIRSLAQTTPFSPTQVAGAATELARGGFNPEEISNSLQAVLDLARSTNTELDFAAKFVVRTLSTFRIETTKASEVVSQLVRATRKGTINIDDLEAAMRYSSGTADTLGVSLQKMLALFTILSNRGLVGSIGGTSTNTALSQLVKKAEELKEIGKIELVTGFKDDGKEAIDVIRSLENLFKFAETLPFTEQQTLFQDIFNLRGARSVAALRDQIGNVNKLAESIADAKDEARQAAVIVDDGLGGAFRRLVSTVQDVTSKLDKQTETTLIKLTDRIRGVIVAIGELIAANPTIATIAILSPGILLAAGAGMLAFSKALRLAAFAAGSLKGALQPIGQLFAKGTGEQIVFVGRLSKALSSTSVSMLAVANIARRFVFSLGGILTGIELLLLVGNKVPILKNTLDRLGQSFSNVFQAISNISRLAAGPLKLFRVSIDAFAAGKSKVGVEALKLGFQSLLEIIGNQLVAAWNRFKQALGPVYDTILAIAKTIYETGKFLVQVVASNVATVFNTIVGGFSSLDNILSNTSGGTNLQAIIKGVLGAIGTIATQITIFTINFGDLINNFLERFEALLLKFASSLGLGLVVDLEERLKNVSNRTTAREATTKSNIAAAKATGREFQASLNKIFGAAPTEIRARREANAAANRSSFIARQATLQAAAFARAIQARPSAPQQFSNFDQSIRQGSPTNNPSVIAMREIADALVGSVQSTRQNLLRSGKPIEQKQLEEAQKQTAIQQKIAENQGVLFAP